MPNFIPRECLSCTRGYCKEQSLRIWELLESSLKSYRRVSLHHGDAVEENYMGCVWGHDILGFVMESLRSEGEEKLALLLIGQSSYRWLEKMLTLEGKLLAESVLREKNRFPLSSRSWDKDCLSVWRTLYNWNLRFITDPRPAKHILWRCVDIW